MKPENLFPKTKNIVFTLIIIGCILASYYFAYLPLLVNAKNAPSDVQYLGTTEYPIDVLGNLITIKNGMMGRLVHTSKVTTGIASYNAPFIKSEYILIGQIARVVKISDTFTAFFVARAILSGISIIVVYLFCKKFLKEKTFIVIAFILSLFAAGITRIGYQGQIWDMMYSDGIIFARLTTAMPHYLLGVIFCLGMLLAFDRFTSNKITWKTIVTVFILTLTGTFINVTTVVIPVICTVCIMGWSGIQHRNNIRKAALWIIPVLLAFILPSLYLMYVGRFWEFSMFARTEKLWNIPFTPAMYLDAVGLVYVLSLLSIPGIIHRKKAGEMVLLTWLVLHPFMVFIGSDLLHFNNIRMFYVPQYVVFSVLATIGLQDVYRLAKHSSIHLARVVVGLAVMVVIWSSWGTYRLYYEKTRVSFGSSRWPYPYGAPKKTVYDAILWLRDNTKGESVLSGYHSGTMIPGIAGNFVYTSWWLYLSQDPRLGEILKPQLAFWYREMTDAQAQEFLEKNGIRYIFFGPEERGVPRIASPSVYPFLTRVFTNGDVEIYKYKKSSL